MAETKALFIPLRTEWFRKFEDGSKDTEYRVYGPRWNERTCFIGRPAVLAHGYGHPRLNRTVSSFKVLRRWKAPKAAREIFPHALLIAAIGLR